ncbi:MAG: hypothetical protein L7R83_05210 [Candidatus Poseidonia sp.]|nr:hypothetical protein [Poseidonia sp.]
MGLVRHAASILLLQGQGLLPFLDGLSTNHVAGPCTTVFTNRAAKIIDVCEVIPVGEHVAVVGHEANKEALKAHLSQRILGQPITITDISDLNDVFIDTGDSQIPPDATVHVSFFGRVFVVPVKHNWQPTWTIDQWNEHRIAKLIPYHGYEITGVHHPLACGLGELVHPQKGCYIGQEVLARMRSRGKQGHRLVVGPNPVEKPTTPGKEHSLSIVRVQ